MSQLKEDLEAIRDILIHQNQTLSVAESVTGGNVQALLTSVSMAISFFQGGITTYNIGQKVKHLGVEPIHAIKYNSVSEKVARELSIGAVKLFMSTYAIAVTGYVGPDDNNESGKPLAYISIAAENMEPYQNCLMKKLHVNWMTEVLFNDTLLNMP